MRGCGWNAPLTRLPYIETLPRQKPIDLSEPHPLQRHRKLRADDRDGVGGCAYLLPQISKRRRLRLEPKRGNRGSAIVQNLPKAEPQGSGE